MKADGTNETMPGPNGHNARPQPKMPGTMEQRKSNQREKATFVPLQKIRCAPLPKTRGCVHPSKRRRSVPLQPKKKKKMCSFATRREDAFISQWEKMCSSAKYKTSCVHLQKKRGCVHVPKKREDVFICHKEQMFSSAKKRKDVFIVQFQTLSKLRDCQNITGLMLELNHDAPMPRHSGHKQTSPLGCN